MKMLFLYPLHLYSWGLQTSYTLQPHMPLLPTGCGFCVLKWDSGAGQNGDRDNQQLYDKQSGEGC